MRNLTMPQTSSLVTAYPDRNVYILGAGFSVDARIPVVEAFMNKMRDSTAWLAQEGRQREAQAVANVLKFRLEAAAAAYRVNVDVENVEQLFSLASASRGPYGKDVPLAIAATVDFAHRTGQPKRCHMNIGDPIQFVHGNASRRVQLPVNTNSAMVYLAGNRECSRYDYYLALMTGSLQPTSNDRINTIISFNYDLIVEDSLDRLGLVYDYGLSSPSIEFDSTARCKQTFENFGIVPPSEVIGVVQSIPKIIPIVEPVTPDSQALKLLKLHGSVNWAAADEQQKVKVYGDYQAVLNANRSPLLVPPTWRKHFTELSTVWDDAVASLQTATRIIIIGYSMPSTDQHFKYLLAAGLQDNISLRTLLFVNPRTEQLTTSFYEIFRQQYLERNVEFRPFTVARYLSDENETVKINRSMMAPFYSVGMLDTEPGEL